MTYQVLEDFNLTKNFKLSEFDCNDGSGKVIINMDLVTKLQALRDKVGKAVVVCSAYRTPEYNTKCGGAPASQHLLGKAADVKVSGYTPYQIAVIGEELGFKGIGVYTHNGNSFTHLDVRANKSYWKDVQGGSIVSISKLAEAN